MGIASGIFWILAGLLYIWYRALKDDPSTTIAGTIICVAGVSVVIGFFLIFNWLLSVDITIGSIFALAGIGALVGWVIKVNYDKSVEDGKRKARFAQALQIAREEPIDEAKLKDFERFAWRDDYSPLHYAEEKREYKTATDKSRFRELIVQDYIENSKVYEVLVRLEQEEKLATEADLPKTDAEEDDPEEFLPNPETEVDMSDLFDFVPWHGGAMITKFTGFNEPKIVVPKSIEGLPVIALGESVFEKVLTAEAVVIPSGVVSIGTSCFRYCSALKTVFLPDTLKMIGEFAFSDTGVEELTVPDSVFYIGSFAFYKSKIKKIGLPASLFAISPYTFDECPDLKSVQIPIGVYKIGEKAFFRCKKLSYVWLPAGLKRIDEQAFADCTGLVDVSIPDSVTEIGKNVFGETFQGSEGVPVVIRQMKITIGCEQGSAAQAYARKYGLALERFERGTVDAELNPVVFLVKRNSFVKSLASMQEAEEDIVRECGLSTVDDLYYEKEDTRVFRSDNPAAAYKMHGQNISKDSYMLSEA